MPDVARQARCRFRVGIPITEGNCVPSTTSIPYVLTYNHTETLHGILTIPKLDMEK